MLGGANCGDTLFRVMSSLDVTNNPHISWDGIGSGADALQSFTTGDGNVPIIYDERGSNPLGFQPGEDNKVTLLSIFRKNLMGPSRVSIEGLHLPSDRWQVQRLAKL